MNWKNLKNSKCPNCGSLLKAIKMSAYPYKGEDGYGCTTKGYNCTFSISKTKFEQIVNDLYKPKKFQSDDDRLSELNNFGRKEIGEGFLEY